MLKLGILDQVHIGEGFSAMQALQQAAQLAQAAEKLGYHRYWVSEHHGSPMLAFSTPEILVAHLAAATSNIRVGSGGVMLPHYSAYKMAENFRLLEALHPGRIDMGLGRAPGGMPLATRALQEDKYVDVRKYPHQISDLIGYLYESLPPDHEFAQLTAAPTIPTAPEVWLLGSSGESARIAAEKGTSYGFAQFFGSPGGEDAVRYYKEHFQPSIASSKPHSLAAILVVCADTEEEANLLASSTELFFLLLERGYNQQFFPSVETAQRYPYTDVDRMRIEMARPRRIVGNPIQVKEQILALHEQFGTDELLIVSPIHDFNARIKSFRLIAEAFNLSAAN